MVALVFHIFLQYQWRFNIILKMFLNKGKQKAQAMVEYILIIVFTSLAFISSAPMIEQSLKSFFAFICSLWGSKSP